jgi:replicative DNA helicase Mcm
MEVNEIISKFQEFIESTYQKDLFRNIKEGKHFLVIEFNELAKFNIELSEELLEKPEETLKAFELSMNNFDIEDVKDIKVRVKNLPKEHYIMIRNVRSKEIGKFIWTEGVVRQKSDVRPQVTSARFECPSCGNIIPVLQLDKKFKEPSRCGCGRKGKFRLLSKELVDAQGLVLEEATKDLEGGAQPKRMNVFLQNDLVSPMSERKTNPGNQIRISGVIKEVPIILRTGGQSTKFDLMIEANSFESVEEDYSNIQISEEDEEQLKIISEDPKVITKLSQALAPGIFGHDLIKEAMCLQFVGGVSKLRDDGVRNRGDLHMLLIGDPGCGKCVAGDTKIIQEDGELTTIKEFHDKNSKKKVFTIDGQGNNDTRKPTTFWKRPSPKKLLKITTNTGNKLILTKEHPLFTTKNGFVFAKEAQDFCVNEYISTPSKIDVITEQQFINFDIEKSRSRNKVKYQQKQILDKEWARLLGYLIGDGYVRLRKTTGVISFTNTDQKLLTDFEYLIKSIFNLDVKKRQKQGTKCYEYYLTSIEITRILAKIDDNILKRSDKQQIPKSICKSTDEILKEFLKAFFDCEGHVNKDKRRIEISSKSKNIIEDLKYLLLRFNILSQIKSMIKYASNTLNKTKRTYYQLSISGEDVIKFNNNIGLNSNKVKILQKLSKNDVKLNTNLNIVPNINELLYVLRTKYGLTQASFSIPKSSYQHYERGDRHPSHKQLEKIYKTYLEKEIKDPLLNILKQATNADIFWDKIKEIKIIESNENYVYDFEIPEIHNFVANGIMVHNSQLLKRASVVAPKARYVSGKGVSGAGLTAAVVKDEFLSGWSLEAGALVLANKGMVMIDEMDKMSTEDRSAMHEALEQQTVSISKANIQATLRCETTVLAAANPKFGRFDPYDTVAGQIDLPPALINRFDLIFTLKDIPDEEKDKKMARFILEMHKVRGTEETDISTDLLRKYFVYSKQKMSPKLSQEAIEEIMEYYIKMRGSGASEDKAMKAIPISARQLEALVRLSEASSKLRLGKEVTIKDAKRAIALLNYCLEQVGMDPETGKIDIDRISTGVTTSERGRIITVRDIINELEESIGKNIPIEEVVNVAKEKGLDENKTLELIEKLKRSGDLFEPRRGEIQKI